jgi:hypothetical protein
MPIAVWIIVALVIVAILFAITATIDLWPCCSSAIKPSPTSTCNSSDGMTSCPAWSRPSKATPAMSAAPWTLSSRQETPLWRPKVRRRRRRLKLHSAERSANCLPWRRPIPTLRLTTISCSYRRSWRASKMSWLTHAALSMRRSTIITVRNPVQGGHRFQRKADSIPVIVRMPDHARQPLNKSHKPRSAIR